MANNERYVGRHRPPSTPSRGRYVVPVAVLSTGVAGGLVARAAVADERPTSTAAGADTASDHAVAAAALLDARGNDAASRGDARQSATASVQSSVTNAGTVSGVAGAQDSLMDAGTQAALNGSAKVVNSLDTIKGVGGGTSTTEPADKQAAAKAKAAKAKQEADQKAAKLKKARTWVSPISGYTLTSGYGWRWGKMHAGQDYAVPVGTPVRAMSSGTVVFAGWDNTGYGRLVKIQYWDGTSSWYAHNSRILVSVGETVSAGEIVARSGNTGWSTGPHMHLEIHLENGATVSPRKWLANKGLR